MPRSRPARSSINSFVGPGKLAGYCILATSIAAAFSCYAEDGSAASDSASASQTRKAAKKSVTTLGSVSVSSQKGAEKKPTGALGSMSELDTPFSESTITSEKLQSTQAVSLAQAYQSDSSVSRSGSDYNGYAARGLLIRGLPVDMYNSVKIDGLPGGFLYGVNLPLEDMDQVQLLKGASGFMYGFSAPGGIFNYTLKKPTDWNTLSFDVGYRSTNLYSEHVDVGGRAFADGRLGYRMNLSHEEGTSYTGSHVVRNAAAFSFDYRLTDTLTWTANAIAQNESIDNPVPVYYTSRYTEAKLPKALNGSTNWSSDQDVNKSRFYYLATGLDWKISDNWSAKVDLTSARTNYRLSQEYIYLKTNAGAYQTNTFDGLDITADKYAQAMLQGKFYTGPLEHDVVMGVSRLHRTLDFAGSNYSPGSVVRGYGNIYDPERIIWSPASNLGTYPVETTNQNALFVSDSVSFLEKWRLLAALRYTDYQDNSESSYTTSASGRLNFAYTYYSKKVVTPTYALIFKPSTDSTLYASYVEALEQGSTVGSAYTNYGQTLAPLVSDQYEVGYKFDKARWNASAAIFRVDRGAEYANAANEYVQDGKIRYQGVELEGNLSMTDNLRGGVSLTYLDAKYKDASSTWIIGQAPAGTSRFTGAVNFSYSLNELPGLSLEESTRYTGKGVAYDNTSYDISVKAAAYSVTNVGLAYKFDQGEHEITLRLGVDNLFDKQYWQVGSGVVSLGTPRVYAFNAKYDF